jgi:hypothetical protein
VPAMSVPASAVADGDFLLTEQQAWLLRTATPEQRAAYGDLGRHAVARGVDALGFSSGGRSFVVILNQGVVTVEEAP